MFSSLQKFTVNGCDDTSLKKVLELAIELSDYKHIKAFYEDKNGLVLCSYEVEGSTKYPFEPTSAVLVEHINQYISNLSHEDILRLAGVEPDIDGTVRLGWEVFHPMWYGDDEIDKYELCSVLAVRPCWIVFAK